MAISYYATDDDDIFLEVEQDEATGHYEIRRKVRLGELPAWLRSLILENRARNPR
jgi:hypothetical protein